MHRALADGAYDRNELFNTLEHRGIASGIKTRVDAATHSTGSPYRAECVRDRNRWGGYPMWSRVVTYGMRWKVEGAFSRIKRSFGNLTSRPVKHILLEHPGLCVVFQVLRRDNPTFVSRDMPIN